MGPSSSLNNFYGIKISKQGIPVNQASDNNLTYKQDFNNGTMTVFGSNGDINFGVNPDSTLGMNVQDTSGNLLFEMSGQTWAWYDTSGNVVMYVGYLPVAKVFGWAVATPGNSLLGVV